MLLTWDRAGTTTAEAWGSGAEWLVDRAPHWVGLYDDVGGFDPTLHPTIADWTRRHPGIRLPAAGVIWQELLLVLLGQRVTTEEAVKSWARIVYGWGEPAPGPLDLRLPPTPEIVASKSYVDLHRFNVERRRADAILLAARRANRLEEAATMAPQAARTRLSALPGLGQWTATSVITATHASCCATTDCRRWSTTPSPATPVVSRQMRGATRSCVAISPRGRGIANASSDCSTPLASRYRDAGHARSKPTFADSDATRDASRDATRDATRPVSRRRCGVRPCCTCPPRNVPTITAQRRPAVSGDRPVDEPLSPLRSRCVRSLRWSPAPPLRPPRRG